MRDAIGYVALGGMATYILLIFVVAHRLETRHPDAWAALGSPSFFNYSISNSHAIGTWVLYKAGHRALNDPALTTLVFAMRALVVLSLGAFAVALASKAH